MRSATQLQGSLFSRRAPDILPCMRPESMLWPRALTATCRYLSCCQCAPNSVSSIFIQFEVDGVVEELPRRAGLFGLFGLFGL